MLGGMDMRDPTLPGSSEPSERSAYGPLPDRLTRLSSDLRRGSFAWGPVLLVSPYLLFALRGGMPERLPSYMGAVSLLLAAAWPLVHSPRTREALSKRPRTVLALGAVTLWLTCGFLGWTWNPEATIPEISNFHPELLDALKGGPFTHPTENRTEFAIHFSPVLLFGLPLYMIHPRPIMLFLLGAGAMMLALPVAWRFLRSRWGDASATLLALGFALYPPILGIHLDFSPVRFVPLALWAAITGYREKNVLLLGLGIAAAWMAKEIALLPLVMLGAVALVERRKAAWVAGPAATAFLLFYLTVAAIIPWFADFSGASTIAAQFGRWGSTAPGVVIGMIRDPVSVLEALFRLNNLAYLLKLGHPVLFLAPLGSPLVLLALPELLINMLAGFNPGFVDPARPGPWTSLVGHYSAGIGTVLWAAAAEAFAPKAAGDETVESLEDRRWKRAALLFLAVLSSVIYPTNIESIG